jgi:hypothetical protein
MNNCYYVYALLDPSNKGEFVYENKIFEYEPFYIGRGKKERLILTRLIERSSSYKKNKLKE